MILLEELRFGGARIKANPPPGSPEQRRRTGNWMEQAVEIPAVVKPELARVFMVLFYSDVVLCSSVNLNG